MFDHSRDPSRSDAWNRQLGKCALNVAVGRSLGMEIGIARMWEGVVAFDPVLTVKERKKVGESTIENATDKS